VLLGGAFFSLLYLLVTHRHKAMHGEEKNHAKH
jgi:hypothetical protein